MIGKSTLAAGLVSLLASWGLKCAVASLDGESAHHQREMAIDDARLLLGLPRSEIARPRVP